jgi:hypothetical protein
MHRTQPNVIGQLLQGAALFGAIRTEPPRWRVEPADDARPKADRLRGDEVPGV